MYLIALREYCHDAEAGNVSAAVTLGILVPRDLRCVALGQYGIKHRLVG
jgi:hypothetical protein